MRYLINAEFRQASSVTPHMKPRGAGSALSAALRHELSMRNLLWAKTRNYAHEVTMGTPPAVLYREDESGVHGNFQDASYRAIKAAPAWARRLGKVHTSARRALLSRDVNRRELDSSNSSDALLMNIFCHPQTLTSPSIQAMLSIDIGAQAVFGYRPRIVLSNGKQDATEIDLNLGDLLIEAKLTEADFQTAPLRLVKRYRDLEAVFDTPLLDIEGDYVRSYQLIRGILAVAASNELRFCVLCDARRVDLIDEWHRVIRAVRLYDLRCRLQLLTWQELAACSSSELREFLDEKFGILPP